MLAKMLLFQQIPDLEYDPLDAYRITSSLLFIKCLTRINNACEQR